MIRKEQMDQEMMMKARLLVSGEKVLFAILATGPADYKARISCEAL